MAQLITTTVSGDLTVLDASDDTIFQVDANVSGNTLGIASINKAPDAAFALDINGDLRADNLFGDGSNLTNVQNATNAAEADLLVDNDGDTFIDPENAPDDDTLTFVSSGTTVATFAQGDISLDTKLVAIDGQAGSHVQLKNETGTLRLRNEVDNDDASLIVKDLTVNGTTTTVNSETVSVADNFILVNSDVSGAPTEDAGLEVNRGSGDNAFLLWDESASAWKAGLDTQELVIARHFDSGSGTGSALSDFENDLTLSSFSLDLTTDDIPEGSTNLYFTEERVDDRVNALLVEGTGTNLTYNDSAGQLTITTDFSDFTTDNLSEGGSNLYYTDERVDDRVAALLVEGTGVSLTYNDSAGSLEIATSLSGATGSTDDLAEGSANLFFTNERAQDAVFPNVIGGVGIDVTYNDPAGTLTIDGAANSDQITEGSTNLFFTEERVDDRVDQLLVGGIGITLTYDDSAGTLTVDSQSIISSTDDVAEGSTNLYFTEERVDDRVDQLLVAGSGITLTYSDSAGTLTIDSDSAVLDNTYIRNDGDTAAGDYDFNTGLFVLNQSANEITSDGDVTVAGTVTAGQFVETSTIRLKEGVEGMGSQLDKLMNLNPVEFTWKTNRKRDKGFIAEQIREVYPEFVAEDENGAVGVNYSKLTSVLVQTIQELNRKVETLESKLA